VIARYNLGMSTEGGQEPPDAAESAPRARVLMVTGMSRARQSTALEILEDIGCESFDSPPASLVPKLFESTAPHSQATTVGGDTWTRGFAAATMLQSLARAVSRHGCELRILLIDCDDERFDRRYTETQRPHPLAGDRPIADASRRERQVVSPVRDRLDLVIDTSILTAADLKRVLIEPYGFIARGLRVFVTAFACRDRIFGQFRSRRSVGREPSLSRRAARTGRLRSSAGQSLIGGPICWSGSFCLRLPSLLPCHEMSRRTFQTMRIGCTGGRHRSIHVADRLNIRSREMGLWIGLARRDLSPPSAGARGSCGALAVSG
jgi:RNase adapter protein RapZ